MTDSCQFDELECDRSRFKLRHKRDNSRFVGNPETAPPLANILITLIDSP